jgi:hypothetical protein
MADPPKQPEQPEQKAVAWLIASFSLVTALLAAVGAAPGSVVDRVLKNESDGMFLAFTLAILAIVVAVLAYAVGSIRRPLIWISLGFFTTGIVLLTYLLIASRIDLERPIVRGSLKLTSSGMTLEVTAKASGLKAGDEVFVYAWGRQVTSLNTLGEPETFERELVYTSQTGPDRAGVVDLSFEVPIPVGRYTAIGVSPALNEAPEPCDVTLEPTSPAEQQGCLVIRVPATSPRPSLSGRLTTETGTTSVLHVDVSDATVGVGQTLLVRAVAVSVHRERPLPMYQVVVGPNANGQISASFEVPVHPRATVVCVEAAPLGLVVRSPQANPRPGPLACPPKISSVSSRIRMPVRST